MTVQPTRDQLRALADKATPGPWERGNWYHVQSSTHCACHPDHGALVGIDPRGAYGEMHVHRYPDTPVWTEGIRARDDAVGGVDVVIETDEYGTMSDADAEFIAAARTAVPRLLDQLDAAEQRIRDLTQEVRDERGAARDQMEQVRIRDALIDQMTASEKFFSRLTEAEARIAAVDAELLYAELHGNLEVWTANIRRALEG